MFAQPTETTTHGLTNAKRIHPSQVVVRWNSACWTAQQNQQEPINNGAERSPMPSSSSRQPSVFGASFRRPVRMACQVLRLAIGFVTNIAVLARVHIAALLESHMRSSVRSTQFSMFQNTTTRLFFSRLRIGIALSTLSRQDRSILMDSRIRIIIFSITDGFSIFAEHPLHVPPYPTHSRIDYTQARIVSRALDVIQFRTVIIRFCSQNLRRQLET